MQCQFSRLWPKTHLKQPRSCCSLWHRNSSPTVPGGGNTGTWGNVKELGRGQILSFKPTQDQDSDVDMCSLEGRHNLEGILVSKDKMPVESDYFQAHYPQRTEALAARNHGLWEGLKADTVKVWLANKEIPLRWTGPGSRQSPTGRCRGCPVPSF